MERRRKRSREEWARIVSQQEQSELTAAAFCRQEEIGVLSFYHWKRRLSEGNEGPAGKGGESFIDMGRVDVSGLSAVTGARTLVVTLELGDGARLTVQRG